MAIFNEQPVIPVKVVDAGTALFNGLPTLGVYEAGEDVTFERNKRVIGCDVLDEDKSFHNYMRVRGVVLVPADTELFNNQPVMPAYAVSGSFSPDPGGPAILTPGFIDAIQSPGYSDGSAVPATGSLSAEPIPGFPMVYCYSTDNGGPYASFVFNGDATAAVAGKTIWINGAPLVPAGDPAWIWQEPYTIFSAALPAFFEEGVAFTIEVKEP